MMKFEGNRRESLHGAFSNPKLDLCSHTPARSEAFGHALAQELALFKSSQTTGGYQSRAPNISAIDWEPARPADTVLVVQPLQEEEEEERRKAAERAVAREKRKREEAEARKAKKPIVLEEEDLDWAGAGEEDDA